MPRLPGKRRGIAIPVNSRAYQRQTAAGPELAGVLMPGECHAEVSQKCPLRGLERDSRM
jgi:hypothetical protein